MLQVPRRFQRVPETTEEPAFPTPEIGNSKNDPAIVLKNSVDLAQCCRRVMKVFDHHRCENCVEGLVVKGRVFKCPGEDLESSVASDLRRCRRQLNALRFPAIVAQSFEVASGAATQIESSLFAFC